MQQGFGLIQLLVGMALIAITAQLAVPGFSRLIENQRREDTAQQLASAVRSARTEAILRNTTVLIQATGGDWSDGWRTVIDVNDNGEADEQDVVLVQRALTGTVQVVGNYWLSRSVRFNSLGLPLTEGGASRGGTLFICTTSTSAKPYRVVLASTGRVQIRTDRAEEALCRSSLTTAI
jgi:type IV fimbrial biogenesis protein FimT